MAFSLTHAINNGDTSDAVKVNENDQGVAAALAGQYRKVFEGKGLLDHDAAAGTYFLGASSAGGVMVTSPYSLSTTSSIGLPLSLFDWDDADYALSGLTLKLRLRFQVASNATASAITFTAGLYPLTVAGAADTLTYTAGTVVSGSTVAHASPSASTVARENSGDFTIPSDGAFSLAVVTSGTLTNNSAVSCHAQLQVRAV